FTRAILDKLPGREKIHDRLSTLLEIGTIGTPWPVKGRYFYTKREGKQNQAILYVRARLRGNERVPVDAITLAKDGVFAVLWWFPTSDGRLCAYALSANGSVESKLYVGVVTSGQDLPDRIDRTRACSVAWQPDSKGFYSTRYPAAGTV